MVQRQIKQLSGSKEQIIIVGAGAAGCMAALELLRRNRKVLLLEASKRVGGRIHTIPGSNDSPPMEAGAEFVHGNLPHTQSLLRKYGIELEETGGRMVRIENGKLQKERGFAKGWDSMLHAMQRLEKDLVFSDFLQTYFGKAEDRELRQTAIRFAEGFDVADTAKASTKALFREWSADWEQFRVKGGYQAMIDAMVRDCDSSGAHIMKSCPVSRISWEKGHVRATTIHGQEWSGSKILLTVPIGVLTRGTATGNGISFHPALPEKMKAASHIGYGNVIKILLDFNKPFWNELAPGTGFIITDQVIPTWWTQLPEKNGVLTGWIGGPKAGTLSGKTESMILTVSLHSLAAAFGKDYQTIRSFLKNGQVFIWENDPYALGGYSFSMVETAAARQIMNMPVEQTVYFAGEGVYEGEPQGTVESALASGSQVAIRMAEDPG
jgi:monoamine oxidase